MAQTRKLAARGKGGGQFTMVRPGEIAGVLLALLALVLFIAFASYTPDDPPNSVAGAEAPVHNLCGIVGAHVASWSHDAVGHGKFLLLLWLVMFTYRRFRPVPPGVGFLEGLGFGVGVLSLTMLLARFDAGWGGVFGLYLNTVGARWLGEWGSVLLALAGLLCCLVLTTRFSLRDLLAVTGTGAALVLRHSMTTGGELVRSLREHWLQRRTLLEPARETAPPRVKRPRDGAEEPGKGRRKGTEEATGEEEVETFSKPVKPKIQRPEAEEPVAEETTDDGKVVSLAKKRKEREATGTPAAENGEDAAGSAPASPGPRAPQPVEAAPIHATDDYDPAAYVLPSLTLLQDAVVTETGADDAQMLRTSDLLVKTLRDFDIECRVDTITPGPVVTLYELLPAAGVPVNKFVSRQDDLKLALAAKSIRIVAPIPGKSAVGIEVPNPQRANVFFKEIAQAAKFRDCSGLLKVVLGKDALGAPNFLELDKMPHLLIAGATGSGKSVCIHSLITSLLLNAAPHQLKFVMIDPKQVELAMYRDIPHLLSPVVTDPKDATRALRWLCGEMDARYETLANATCRDITRYNEKQLAAELPVMPYVVVIIDELADLMAVAAQECEAAIARLTAKARAVGIHLVLATQRPSVDVITGLIKANLPARIAFAVLAKVDSRTIIDQNGAETLLGNGDMLYQDPRSAELVRMQGAYLSEQEIEAVVAAVKAQGRPHYHLEVTRSSEQAAGSELTDEDRDYYEDAKRVIIRAQKGSIMLLQRTLKVSYPRAQRLIDQMEKDSVVGPQEGPKARKVLVTYKDYYGEELDGDVPVDDAGDDLDANADGTTDGDHAAGDDDDNRG